MRKLHTKKLSKFANLQFLNDEIDQKTHFDKLPIVKKKIVHFKVASSRLSLLVAHSRIFRLFMKGKFDAYVL